MAEAKEELIEEDATDGPADEDEWNVGA